MGVSAVPMPQPAGTISDGLNGNVAYRRVGRVEQQLLPLQHRHFLGHAGRHNAVQMGVKRSHALRHDQMELVEVHVVAAPLDGLPIGREDHPGNRVHRAGGPVVAGNPLRSGEGQRPGGDRQIDLGVIELARRIGQVGSDLDGGALRQRGGDCKGKQESMRQGSGKAGQPGHRRRYLLRFQITAAAADSHQSVIVLSSPESAGAS